MSKTVFITGSESFIGKELISQCLPRGIVVVGVDKVVPAVANYNFRKVDIRSFGIARLIPKGADAVIHLAALSRDSDCRDNAYECFDINVMGTLNMMRAAKERGVKQFIFASTEWVYDRLQGEYAFSKLVSERNLGIQFKRGFCDTTILRFGIIYGPRKSNWSAVESIFDTVKNGSEVTIGSKKTGRRFIHVSDIAIGIISSLGLSGFNIIDLTGDRIITLEEIIEESEKILGKKVKILETNPKKSNVRDFSNARAKQLLSWSPKIDLREGLRSLL